MTPAEAGDRDGAAHLLQRLDRRHLLAPWGAAAEPGGPITYWHVDDIAAVFGKLLSMGAKEYQPVTPRGATRCSKGS